MSYNNPRHEGPIPNSVKKGIEPIYPDQKPHPNLTGKVSHLLKDKDKEEKGYDQVGVSDGFIEG